MRRALSGFGGTSSTSAASPRTMRAATAGRWRPRCHEDVHLPHVHCLLRVLDRRKLVRKIGTSEVPILTALLFSPTTPTKGGLRMRKHLTPSLIVAIMALFFALGGGAYAAKKYIITSTSQIKPSVVQKLKGNRGPQGAQGIPGVNGTNGTKGDTGATGPRGQQGIPGTAAAKGEKGDKGDPGATGAPGEKGATGAQG